jgi:SpoVK/Ycf46/Vps4 family AAA+-type ATPase
MFFLRTLTHFVQCLEKTDELRNFEKRVNQKVLELKKNFGTQMMAFPEFSYQMKGENFSISFTIDSRKGTLPEVMVALEQPKNCRMIKKDVDKIGNVNVYKYSFNDREGDFDVSIIGPSNSYFFKLEYTKTGNLVMDLDRIIDLYTKANYSRYPSEQNGKKMPFNREFEKGNPIQNEKRQSAKGDPIENLQKLGARVYKASDSFIDWDYLAGYEEAKREIEDTILLALERPDIFDKITLVTRVTNEKNRPKAVLFEGPPGTGKTTSAKIISQQVKIPLVYVQLESLMSKYYGEAEKNLGEIFNNCISLGKCMIFIDEIDSLAQSRENEMHEATRRVLSVFLRYLDGIESSEEVIVICATNRKTDLDPALQSRFSKVISFPYPDKHSRAAIFQRYAKHLERPQLNTLGDKSEMLTGRDIKAICEDAERQWAAFLLRGEQESFQVPFQIYLASLESRMKSKGLKK